MENEPSKDTVICANFPYSFSELNLSFILILFIIVPIGWASGFYKQQYLAYSIVVSSISALLFIFSVLFIQIRGFVLYEDRFEIVYKLRPKFLFKTTSYVVPLTEIDWVRYVDRTKNRPATIRIVLKDKTKNIDYYDYRYIIEVGTSIFSYGKNLKIIYNHLEKMKIPFVDAWDDSMTIE